jgi:hypothetical protein
MVDPYNLLRVLEDVTRDQASTVRSLERILSRLRSDLYDEDLQQAALTHLRRLRLLRTRLEKALEGSVEFGNVDKQVLDSVATLSEYMIIVGFELERKVLERARLLARRGARLLNTVAGDIERDLEQLERVSEKLQEIVDRYY